MSAFDFNPDYGTEAQEQTIVELLARIKGLEEKLAGREWRPIETAPKDGTEVDIWFDKGTGNYGFRIADCYWSGDGWYSQNHTDAMEHEMCLDDYIPTHWMTLIDCENT